MTAILTTKVPTYGQVTRISSSKRSAVRKSFTTPKLDPQHYEIRVRRTTPDSKELNISDDIYLSDVNEILLEKLSYPNTALLALKIRLTDQLSSIPTVTYINGGRVIWSYGQANASATTDSWYETASKNPAWIVWDILTNRRYGGSMPSARLDLVAFKDWADYCETLGLEWNGSIEDSNLNVWDAAQPVLRVGHAQIVNVGTRFTVVVERAADPVMMFSVANMVEGSYKETWLGTVDRANEIDVTFFDKTDNFKQRTVKVYDPAVLTSGAKQRTSAITLQGITDYETAYREAQFQLNLNRFILKTVNFSAPLEAVACSVGDLIYVQHDMTEWAQAGRFAVGSTTSVMKLDRPVKMELGKQYKLLLSSNAVARCQNFIGSVVGNTVFLDAGRGWGLATAANVKRFVAVGGIDRPILSFNNYDNGSHSITLEDVTGLTSGQTFFLVDTDVIEEHNVVNLGETTSSLTLQTNASFSPEQYANWMFGESDKVKSRFRIKSVGGSQEYTRDIVAIEYRPEVYDFARYGSNVPMVPIKNGAISSVRDLTAYEETYISGVSIVTRVMASWRSPLVGLYAGADVYVQKGTGAMIKVSDIKNVNSAVIEAAKGDELTIKVVAYDIFGKRSPYELAPEWHYTVIGELPGVKVGGVTGSGFVWSGRDCKITWRYNSTTHSFEFGSEPTGGDAGSLDPQFKDYEIRVYDQEQKKLRRTEYTKEKSYTYIYDKNFADGIERHLIFEIRMRDIANNLGEPATIKAYNPPPTVSTVASVVSYDSATVAYTHSNDPDFAGAQIWLSRSAADLATLKDSQIVFKGSDSSILLPKLMFNADYYFVITAFDAFGMTELIPSEIQHFKTTFFNVDTIADGVFAGSKLIPELQSTISLITADFSVPGSVNARIAALEEATVGLIAEADLATSGELTALQSVINGHIDDLLLSPNAKILTLETATADPVSGLEASHARIVSIDDVKSDSTSASARKLFTLNASVNDPTTGLAAAAAAIGQINDVTVGSTSAAASTLALLQAQVNDPATGLPVSAAQITALNNVAVDSTSASARQIATLKAQVNDPATGLPAAQASIYQINDVTVGSTSAAASQLAALKSQVNDPATGLPKAQASITALNNVSTSSTSATASQLATLKAVVNDPNTGLAKAQASITALNDVSATSTSSSATQLFALKSQVNDPTTGLAVSQASIDELNNVSTTSTSATASQLASLKSQVNNPTTGLAAAQASIGEINNVTTTSTSAVAKSLAILTAAVNDETTGLPKAKADIVQLNTVSATSTSALARSQYQLAARLNDVGGVTMEQAFTASANATDGLNAQYTLKVDNNGYISGFGFASTSHNGVPTSEFVVNADKFAVVMPTYSSVKPFTIGAVNGVPTVIFSNALIGDASIKTAMIGDLQVNTLKIGANSATMAIGASGGENTAGVLSGGIYTGVGASTSFTTEYVSDVILMANVNFKDGTTESTGRVWINLDGTIYGDVGVNWNAPAQSSTVTAFFYLHNLAVNAAHTLSCVYSSDRGGRGIWKSGVATFVSYK